jgi:squalene-associated FAD-dependent desaturase
MTSSFSTPSSSSAIVVGGGLAGIACAIRLAEAGVKVTLLEARRRLGGRATSFTDASSGETLDNCQHVALGCCTEFLAFCGRLDVLDLMEWSDTQWWVEAGGRTSTLRPGRLPAPAHYAGSFAAASFLSLAEKIAVASALLRIVSRDPQEDAGRTFGEVLREMEQPAGAIAKFWSPVIVSACNLDVDRVAATLAEKVFRDGFSGSRDAGQIALPSVPLVRLYDPAIRVIESLGGRVLFGARAQAVDGGGVTLSDGTRLCGEAVISALPLDRAAEVVQGAGTRADFEAMVREGVSPILGVHLELDRPVLEQPHAVLVDRPTQWLFRKSSDGSRVHAVISAADEWMELDEAEIVARIMDDIAACIPGGSAAKVVRARPVKERRATFAATPRFEAARPAPGSDVGGVVLAGDYTATGWPATMEGAVRSGNAAADAVFTRLGMSSRAAAIGPSSARS